MSALAAILGFVEFAAKKLGPALYDAACEHFGCGDNIPLALRLALKEAARADLPKHMEEVDAAIDAKLRAKVRARAEIQANRDSDADEDQ